MSAFAMTLCTRAQECSSRPAVAASSGNKAELIYTARLLGYARCDRRTSQTKYFVDYMNSTLAAHPDAMVIGMGDNLAPEYEARTDATGAALDRRITAPPVDDPIVRLFNNYYDVVVPGKEDFYFGAERLRLTGIAAPVINASNLTITANYTTQGTHSYQALPRNYVAEHPSVKTFDDGHVVFSRAKGAATYSLRIKSTETLGNLVLTFCDADDTLQCHAFASGKITSPTAQVFTTVTWDLSSIPKSASPGLRPGTRRLMCLSGLSRPASLSNADWSADHSRYCHAVAVDQPLLPAYPYSLIIRGDRSALFIPVVDPAIAKELPSYNRTWKSDDPNVSVEVAFADPEGAILQAYYEAIYKGDCRPTDASRCTIPVIVMAQMDSAIARKLADDLQTIPDFVVLFSRGEQRASPYARELDYNEAGVKLPVVVPRPFYLEDDSLRNPIHLLEVNSNQTLSNLQAPAPGDLGTKIWREPPTGTDGLQHNGFKSVPALVAELLRQRYQADAGLVSSREIYEGQAIKNTQPISEQTSRVIWEGSHAALLRISGAKLKQVLDASHDAPDGHELNFAGIVESDDKRYWINSRPLDESTYYRVVVPDTLAFADPNYPALANDTFAKPEIRNEQVSYLLCSYYAGPAASSACTNAANDRGNYPAGFVPFSYPGRGSLKEYLAGVIAPHHHDPFPQFRRACARLSPTEECDRHELVSQFRRVFFANLLSNNISYALTKAHPNDKTVGTKFAGVTDPRVVQAHSESYSASHDLQIGLRRQRFTLGIEDVASFGRSRQGNLSGGKDSVTLTANTGTVGPFLEWAFVHTSAPEWRVVVRPVDFRSNFARTIASLTGAADGSGNATTFTESLPAQKSVISKIGLRYETPQRQDSLDSADGNAFLEFGFRSTNNLNVPSSLLLNPGFPSQTRCALVAGALPLGDCTAAVTAAEVSLPQRNAVPIDFTKDRQNGAYWTGIFHFPLSKRFTYKIASDGEVNPRGNFNAETYYAATLDNYLQTRIWGNFSLAPHFGWFFYESQGQQQALLRHTEDISLTYAFSWHQGLGWRAFFMNPETAASK